MKRKLRQRKPTATGTKLGAMIEPYVGQGRAFDSNEQFAAQIDMTLSSFLRGLKAGRMDPLHLCRIAELTGEPLLTVLRAGGAKEMAAIIERASEFPVAASLGITRAEIAEHKLEVMDLLDAKVELLVERILGLRARAGAEPPARQPQPVKRAGPGRRRAPALVTPAPAAGAGQK